MLSQPEQISKILVIAVNKIGDVLLTTPLISAIAERFPSAEIDVLVRPGHEGILLGNPFVRHVIPCGGHQGLFRLCKFWIRLFRAYDCAISTGTSDRQVFYALLSARKTVSLLPDRKRGLWWKKRLVSSSTPEKSSSREHVLERMNRLGTLLSLEHRFRVIAPITNSSISKLEKLIGYKLGTRRYVVIHPIPGALEKFWVMKEWQAVINAIPEDLDVVISGSALKSDRSYIDDILNGLERSVLDLSGMLELADCSVLLENATALVAPDTFIGHLGAGLSLPTVSLFGPSDRNLWFPWPGNRSVSLPDLENDAPSSSSSKQRSHRIIDNVAILPGTPSHSSIKDRTLKNVTAQEVIAALEGLGVLKSSRSVTA